jgi:tetratricopeptide (TPR) repeat protein
MGMRSSALSGRYRQLDRAQQRGRLDRARRERLSRLDASTEPLDGWLRAHEDDDSAAFERIDLRTFLRETSHTALAPAERLRQLAIHGERVLPQGTPREWLAVDRVYREALAADPEDPEVYLSRAITAHACAQLMDAAPAKRRAIHVAREGCSRAAALAPSDPRPHYTLGLVENEESNIETALAEFELTLRLGPRDSWAHLYRAHCLHDLARWSEAADEYSRVDPNAFAGARWWRYELLLEQRAECWRMAGETARAEAEFARLLQRWSSATLMRRRVRSSVPTSREQPPAPCARAS